MRRSTFRKLSFVNSKLAKYNMLASIENRGFFDCNKYYVSLRYVVLQKNINVQELRQKCKDFKLCSHRMPRHAIPCGMLRSFRRYMPQYAARPKSQWDHVVTSQVCI